MTAGLAQADRLHRLYKVTAPDGRAYIGCTNGSLETRWKGHVSVAFGCYAHIFQNNSLQAAIVRFGADSFRMEELGVAPNRAAGFQRERELIIQHQTLAPRGFNARMSRSIRDHDVINLRSPRLDTWPMRVLAA